MIASADWLDRAVRTRTKDELVEFVLELARGDSRIKRRFEARFQVEPTGEDLVDQTAVAIADATDFDEREINRNFDYDFKAYELVKRNLTRMVKSGRLSDAMGLALELMNQGSYQVEMSDEGLMAYELEECLRVVIKGVQKSDIPQDEVRKWCQDMFAKDRIKCLCQDELQALLDRPGASRTDRSNPAVGRRRTEREH